MTKHPTISNFYINILRNFNMISSIADLITPLIKESMEKYNLELKDSDSFFVCYRNSTGMDVRIRLTDIREGVRQYTVEINGKSDTMIPEELINAFIITEVEFI